MTTHTEIKFDLRGLTTPTYHVIHAPYDSTKAWKITFTMKDVETTAKRVRIKPHDPKAFIGPDGKPLKWRDRVLVERKFFKTERIEKPLCLRILAQTPALGATYLTNHVDDVKPYISKCVDVGEICVPALAGSVSIRIDIAFPNQDKRKGTLVIKTTEE